MNTRASAWLFARRKSAHALYRFGARRPGSEPLGGAERANPACAILSGSASFIAARQRGRPTLYRPINWPRPSPSATISTALDIIGSALGHGRPSGFCWPRGWAAGLAAWAESVSRRRWCRDCSSSPSVFLFITTLAGLPLDAIGHVVSRHYGISVQGWGSWLEDLGKGLCLSVLFGAPVSAALQLDCGASRAAATGCALGWVSLPLIVLSVFASPLLDPIFTSFEPLTKTHSALVPNWKPSWPARERTCSGPHVSDEGQRQEQRPQRVCNRHRRHQALRDRWDTVTTERLPDAKSFHLRPRERPYVPQPHSQELLRPWPPGLFLVFLGLARGVAGRLARAFGVRCSWGDSIQRLYPAGQRQGLS